MRPRRASPRARQRRRHSPTCYTALPHAAARRCAEIARAQRRVNALLYRRVPGELVDEIEDEIIALHTKLMRNDEVMMALVVRARRANNQRPARRRLDLDRCSAPGLAGMRNPSTRRHRVSSLARPTLRLGRHRTRFPPFPVR
jgi:hypothetical protein